ncbi:MAG: PQQ-like beta-propeller repeat protein [Chloroflexi bacterium]|nr:PQQ-like beta-propeller repeat protein [Chloroflexota bacterium]
MKPRFNRLRGLLLVAGIVAVFASGCTFLPQRGGGDLGLKGGYNPPLAAGGLIITKGNDGVTEILSDQFTVPSADFSKTGVVTGDVLVILAGSNRGQYTIKEISKITLVVEGLGSQAREPGLAYEVRGSRIYFSGIDGYVYALGGTVLTKEAELLQAGGLAAPGDTTVFGSAEPDGFIYAIDPLTLSPKQGSKLGWRRPEGKDRTLLPLVAAPVLDRASNTLLVGSEDGNLYAYDAVTGEERWRFATGGKIWSTPVVRDGVVYFGSHDKSVYALFLNSGERKWKTDTGGVVAARPLLFRDQVIIGSFDRNLYSFSTLDGSLRWQIQGDNWFWAGAVTNGSTIFAPSMDGNIYAVDGAGRVLWKHDVGSPIVSTPVMLPEGLVVAGKNGTITVLATTTQDIGSSRVLYSPSPRDAEITAPLFANGSSVFVGANDSTVTRVDVVSQKQIWCFHTKDSICN